MTTKNEVILPESPQAASIQTVTGWVSRGGQFWGNDERTARVVGSTHRLCECGEIIEQRSYCRKCADKRRKEKFLAMKRVPWDGVSMLYSEANDKYYSDPEEAQEDLDDEETLDVLRLVICKPNYASLDEDDFSDLLPDDGYGDCDPPQHLLDAIEAFNADMKSSPLSWSPGNEALDCQSPYGETA